MLGVFGWRDIFFKHLYWEVGGGMEAGYKLVFHQGIVHKKTMALKGGGWSFGAFSVRNHSLVEFFLILGYTLDARRCDGVAFEA